MRKWKMINLSSGPAAQAPAGRAAKSQGKKRRKSRRSCSGAVIESASARELAKTPNARGVQG